MATKAQSADKVNVNDLAKLFGLPDSDKLDEMNADY
jgi:hypothetical protein